MSDVIETDSKRVTRILVREADAIFMDLVTELELPPLPEKLREQLRNIGRKTIRESPELIAEHVGLTDTMMRARFREDFAPGMRKMLLAMKAEMEAETDALDVFAMKIGGHVWGWVDEHSLFCRLHANSIPHHLLVHPERADVLLIETLTAERQSGPPLQVDRTTDPPTIARIPIPAVVLKLAEQPSINGPVTWWSWRGHLVARDAKREPVALWPMPEGHGVQSMFVLALGEAFWACHEHFCMVLLQALPAGPAADIRKASMTSQAKTVDKLVAYLEIAATGAVVPLVRGEHIVTIGGSGVPLDQVRTIEAQHGPDLEWLWPGAASPIGARKGGKLVAMIMPCLPNAPETTSPGGSA